MDHATGNLVIVLSDNEIRYISGAEMNHRLAGFGEGLHSVVVILCELGSNRIIRRPQGGHVRGM